MREAECPVFSCFIRVFPVPCTFHVIVSSIPHSALLTNIRYIILPCWVSNAASVLSVRLAVTLRADSCIQAGAGLEVCFGVGLCFRKPGILRKYWLPGRLRLPNIQNLLDSSSASASLNAVFMDSASASASASKYLFTAGFGLGFGCPESDVWLPRFNRRSDKTFTSFILISIYLQATLFASFHSLRPVSFLRR